MILTAIESTSSGVKEERIMELHVENNPTPQAIASSQARYRALFQQSPEAIYLCDVQTRRLIEANAAFLDMLGYAKDEVGNLTLDDFLAHDATETDQDLNRTLETGEMHVRERLWRRKDGVLLHVEVTWNVIRQDDSYIVFGVGRNISERKRREQELRERGDEFAALFETSRDLAEYKDREQVLDAILGRAIKLLHAPSVGVFFYNAADDVLELAASKGIAPPVGTKQLLGEGLAGFVAQQRQPCVVSDYRQWEHRVAQYEGMPFSASVGVPMLHRGELIGVLVVSEVGDTSRVYTDAETRLLELFGSQAASAVSNANLFAQIIQGRERLKHLSHQLLQTQELERRYLARELHDGIGQMLTALEVNLQLVRRSPPNAKLNDILDESLDSIEETLEQVRKLSLELHPSVLDDMGLVAALEWFLETRVARAGLETSLVAEPSEIRFAPELEITCFRIAQEALTNAVRHSHARHLTIELRYIDGKNACDDVKMRESEQDLETLPSSLEMVIRDDGVGFDVMTARDRAAHGTSLGLIGMQERAQLMGGTLELQSAPDHGTQVRVCFPTL